MAWRYPQTASVGDGPRAQNRSPRLRGSLPRLLRKTLPAVDLAEKSCSVAPTCLARWCHTHRRRAALAHGVSGFLRPAKATLQMAIALQPATFPLDRTADAHRVVESGVVGKVLIDVTARPNDAVRPEAGAGS